MYRYHRSKTGSGHHREGSFRLVTILLVLMCGHCLFIDLAQHYLSKHGISVLRRVKKTDNNRIARAVGATIVSRTDELQEDDVGKECGLFEVKKIGDEYFTYLVKCKSPKACTILLRGASKDILNEVGAHTYVLA